MTQTYLDSFVKVQKQPKKEKKIKEEITCPCVPPNRLKPCQKVPIPPCWNENEKSKLKKYLTVNEMFWLTPEEFKKLKEEYEVIFV